MGLDMYLYRKTYLNNSDIYRDGYRHHVDIKSEPKTTQINSQNVKYVIEEIAYWRKENHIHKWFVDNIQKGVDDCGDYEVTKKQLEQLLESCRLVMDKKEQPESLLPTQRGFFFGPTEYDESYFNGCKDTIEMIEPYIKNYNDETFYYSSSW